MTVSDGGLTASDSFVLTVLNPPPPPPTPTLSVSVVTDKSSYVNGNRVYFTTTITDGVNRVAGAAASLTLVTANGHQVNYNATTDSSGTARFQYKISSNRDGVGTCAATVTGSMSGYNSNSGSATFSVTR